MQLVTRLLRNSRPLILNWLRVGRTHYISWRVYPDFGDPPGQQAKRPVRFGKRELYCSLLPKAMKTISIIIVLLTASTVGGAADSGFDAKLDKFIESVKELGSGWTVVESDGIPQVAKLGQLAQGNRATSNWAVLQLECDEPLGRGRPLVLFETRYFEPWTNMTGPATVRFDDEPRKTVEGEVKIGQFSFFGFPSEGTERLTLKAKSARYMELIVNQSTSKQVWGFGLAGSTTAFDEIAGRCRL